MAVDLQLTGAIGTHAEFDGLDYLYFGGNNYLGLAQAPEVRDAAIEAVRRLGASFGASRHTTGTSVEHRRLEEELAEFCGAEDCVAFASGYLGNQILLQVLVEENTVVFREEDAHPSSLDGIPRSVADVRTFRMVDLSALQKQVEGVDRAVVLLDGLSASGDIAPLDEVLACVEGGSSVRVVVDDAHATGILGPGGRGTPDHFGIDPGRVLQVQTMSKAFGSFGGLVAGSRMICDAMRTRSSTYVGSTSLPPAVVAASRAALRLVIDRPELRERLAANTKKVTELLENCGLGSYEEKTPMFLVAEGPRAREIHGALVEESILVPLVQYPRATGPRQLRLSVSAAHTDEDLERLAGVLETICC